MSFRDGIGKALAEGSGLIPVRGQCALMLLESLESGFYRTFGFFHRSPRKSVQITLL